MTRPYVMRVLATLHHQIQRDAMPRADLPHSAFPMSRVTCRRILWGTLAHSDTRRQLPTSALHR